MPGDCVCTTTPRSGTRLCLLPSRTRSFDHKGDLSAPCGSDCNRAQQCATIFSGDVRMKRRVYFCRDRKRVLRKRSRRREILRKDSCSFAPSSDWLLLETRLCQSSGGGHALVFFDHQIMSGRDLKACLIDWMMSSGRREKHLHCAWRVLHSRDGERRIVACHSSITTLHSSLPAQVSGAAATELLAIFLRTTEMYMGRSSKHLLKNC
jgi:hypothetical protein